MTEMLYAIKRKKPLYNHFYIYLRQLSVKQKSILQNRFSFYKSLTDKEKKYFEHRVSLFIKDKDFIGRGTNRITDEMKVLILLYVDDKRKLSETEIVESQLKLGKQLKYISQKWSELQTIKDKTKYTTFLCDNRS